MPPSGSILPGQPPPLSPGEFEEIRDLAQRVFGLNLKPGKEEMVIARLGRLVSSGGHASFHEYARQVAADKTGVSLAALIDALTTNHTSFLRESDHFEFFCRRAPAELASRQAVEIWCAACSTGEEAWSLACLWNDLNPGRTLRIYASDISNRALRRAQAAEYSKEACAALPSSWLDRFFELIGLDPQDRQGPRYRVRPVIRSQVEFRRINLMDPFPWLRPFAAVFCRNVMIYFDHETQEQLIRRLADCLEPGGYLFTGHAEGLANVSHSLEYVQPAVYRKPAPGSHS